MKDPSIVDHDEITGLNSETILNPLSLDHTGKRLVGFGADTQTIARTGEVDGGAIVEDDSSKGSIDTGFEHGHQTSFTARTFSDEQHGPA